MTADEIREMSTDGHTDAILREIAAQLAQLNTGLETITAYQSLRVQVEPGQYPIVVSKNP